MDHPFKFISSILFRINNSRCSRVLKSNIKTRMMSNSPWSKKHRIDEAETRILDAVNDFYGGVTVEVKEPMDNDVYTASLRASLSQWRQQGKKGVWIKLPSQQADLVAPTIKEGFRYHHAEPEYLMLVRWLPENIPDTIPANASHTVGIGAFVINDKREVLVVQEKNGAFKGTGVWKFPTGVVDQGEDICSAAIREVKEETGIDTEFAELLTFRQTHKTSFGKSDMFFVCMLKAVSLDIKTQDAELVAAQWMPIENYVAQPYNQKHEAFKYVAELCLAKSKGEYNGMSAVPTRSSSGKVTYLYANPMSCVSKI